MRAGYGQAVFSLFTLAADFGFRVHGGVLEAFMLSQAATDSPVGLKIMKDVAATVQSIATIIALVVGGWWVLKRRRVYPRAKFAHDIAHVALDNQRILLHVAINAENVGDVLLPIGPVVVCAQQLKPLPDDHRRRLESGGKLLPDGAVDIDWPILERCDQDLAGYELEPGESGAFHFDLVVPAEATTVLVYSYFTNVAKRPKEIGWSTSTMYHISGSDAVVVKGDE